MSSLLGRRGAEYAYDNARRPRWWWILAAAGGATMAFFAVGQMIDDPKPENAFALVLMLGFAALTFGGMALRNRRAGNWMIATSMLPLVGSFWMIPLAVASVLVIVMALTDNARLARLRPAA